MKEKSFSLTLPAFCFRIVSTIHLFRLFVMNAEKILALQHLPKLVFDKSAVCCLEEMTFVLLEFTNRIMN